MSVVRSKLGLCQWFHYEDYETVERTVQLLRELGVRHLRTGISWADFHRERGEQWYRWQMQQLLEFEVLLSVWHTPPSIAEGGTCASPPRRLDDYADFIGQVIIEFGASFDYLELWNEPNNRYKWDFPRYDPQWDKFARMIRSAARVAKSLDKPTVLGGMIPVDHYWLQGLETRGALEDIDVVAIHGFPEMWWPEQPNWEWHGRWEGWEQKVAYTREHAQRSIWITETGLATWDMQRHCPGRHDLQTLMLERAAVAPAERVYWYSLIDLDPGRDAIEGFHVDENEYHMGLVQWDGTRKPAFARMKELMRLQPIGERRSTVPAAGFSRVRS